MATPSTIKELQYRLDKAKLREQKRKEAAAAAPKAYEKRPPNTELIYHDPLNGAQFIGVDINTQSIAQLGGADALGLYTRAEINAIAPASRPEIISNRNVRSPMIQMRWFYGGETGTVKMTAWGTRVVTFATLKSGLKYHSAYFSIKQLTPVTLDAVIAGFNALWNPTLIGTELGVKGRATLYLGETPLAIVKQ